MRWEEGKTLSQAPRAVPSKVLAKETRSAMEQLLRGKDPPLGANPAAVAWGNQDALALQLKKQLATAPPDRIYELALTAAAMGMHGFAIQTLGECVKRAPDHGAAWRKLAELLRLAKRDAEARDADAAGDRATGDKSSPARDIPLSRLKKSERRLRERLKDKPEDEIRIALRNHLLVNPLDAAALRLLAQFELDSGQTALRLLERALDVCPGFVEAREEYAGLLMERRRHVAAAVQTELLLETAPGNEHYRYSHALTMLRIGNFEAALQLMTGLVREHPDEPDHWLLYAQTLRYMGRRDNSVKAYRRCLELRPDMGEAWWGISDLKGDFISEADTAAMRAYLESGELEAYGRMRMLYALAYSLERFGDFAASFAAYEEGAGLFRALSRDRRKGISPSESAEYLRHMKRVFSRENLETKLSQAPAPANVATPIFIVGMPRAGSTLVEQILASHSQVEATRELTLIEDITRDLSASRSLVMRNAYPDCLLDFSRDQMAALGTRYLEESRDHCKAARPWFIDKRPWNWLEVGFIHFILPQAKIIDVRREPMAACFAMFKQLLPDDATFSYDLEELGRYYNNYVAMMEHWQAVLPGRVYFLPYERLICDTDNEIRRMLDYCGLPFEESCLRFWETDRAVLTPSAEQVRRPIYRDALEQWRNFEPWLTPLKTALARPAQI